MYEFILKKLKWKYKKKKNDEDKGKNVKTEIKKTIAKPKKTKMTLTKKEKYNKACKYYKDYSKRIEQKILI